MAYNTYPSDKKFSIKSTGEFFFYFLGAENFANFGYFFRKKPKFSKKYKYFIWTIIHR